jgi:hypothetical protein
MKKIQNMRKRRKRQRPSYNKKDRVKATIAPPNVNLALGLVAII